MCFPAILTEITATVSNVDFLRELGGPQDIDGPDREGVLGVGVHRDVLVEELGVAVQVDHRGLLSGELARADLPDLGLEVLGESPIKTWLPLNKQDN